MSERGKQLVFLGIVLLLWLPALQWATGLVKERPLYGEPDADPFNNRSITFLDRLLEPERYTGFRPSLIRARNQLWFTLFDELPEAEVVRGTNNYLYDRGSIKSLGRISPKHRKRVYGEIARFKRLQDYLAQRNIEFLLVLAPSKPIIYPEFLPRRSKRIVSDSSLYPMYLDALKAYDIQHLDLVPTIQALKKDYPSGVYAPGGLHWSLFGASVAADSFRVKLAEVLEKPLRQVYHTPPVYTADFPSRECDLEKFLNLLHYPSPEIELPQPVVSFGSDTCFRPNLLVIGDSYYETLLATGMLDSVLAKESDYWFYNRHVFEQLGGQKVSVSSLDLEQQIAQRDVVIGFANLSNLRSMPFGFMTRVESELMDLSPSSN